MLALLRDGRAVALLLAASLTILSNTLISPALPGLEARFADTPNAALMTRLLITAPSIVVAIFATFAGALADRFGRRRQLLVGVALFAVAGSAGLWLPSLALILASRLVLGLALALILTAQTALIGDYFAGAARAQFMGLQIAGTNFGGLVFLLLSGALAGISPVLPFAIYLVALLYLPVMQRQLSEPERAGDGAEARPAPGEPGWRLTLTAVVVLVGLSFISFYLLPTQAPYYLVRIGHPEPAAAGMLMGSVTLAGGIVSLAFGRVRPRLGRAGTPALGYVFMAAGFGVLALAHGFALALLGALLVGAAIGLIMPTFLSIALDVAPSHRRGLASGAVTMSVFLGQFLSPLVSHPIIAAVGYAHTFALTAALLVLLAPVALIAFRKREPAPLPDA